MEPEKPKKNTIVDKTFYKVEKKPTLDSFFENILEEYMETKDLQSETFTAIPSKKTLKVAVILPVTGGYQKIGSEGIDLVTFVEKTMGDKLELKVFNTESRKSSISNIAKQLEAENFNVIVGPIFNSETLELASLQTTIPIISLSNDREINKKNVLVFGQNQDDSIKDIVTFFSQQEKKNFMALFPNNANGSRLYRVFKQSVDVNKSEIMRVEFYDDTGISDVSKYISKITNGLVQKTYVSREDKTIIPERKIREMLAQNPDIKLETIYDITEKKTEVLYISGTQDLLPKIISLLNQPANKQKLQNILIVIADFENLNNRNLKSYDNMFFHSNNYYKTKSFNEEFKSDMGYNPSKLATVLYDAISYSVYVNNNTFGNLAFENLKYGTKGFEGLNGSFVFNGNVVRRFGKIMVIKNNVAMEIDATVKAENVNQVLKILDGKSNENAKTNTEELD
jgi:hypothetical protein